MAKIVRSLSAKTDQYGRAEILFRLTINRTTQLRFKTGLYVAASRFKNGEIVKPRANQKELEELREVESSLVSLEQFLLKLTETTPHENLQRISSLKRLTAGAIRRSMPRRKRKQRNCHSMIL